jgi:HEAT repeat protein
VLSTTTPDQRTAMNRANALVRSPYPGHRAAGMRILRNLGRRHAIRFAIPAVTDRAPEVRMEAVATLGHVLASSGSAPPELLAALRDRSRLVRVAGCEALGQIGDQATLHALSAMLLDRDSLVRAFAGMALGRFPAPAVTQRLQAALDNERSMRARVGIADGLLQHRNLQGLQMLLAALKSRQYRVRCAAANSIGHAKLPDGTRPEVMRHLKLALAAEQTVAARSSLRAAMSRLQRRRSQ